MHFFLFSKPLIPPNSFFIHLLSLSFFSLCLSFPNTVLPLSKKGDKKQTRNSSTPGTGLVEHVKPRQTLPSLTSFSTFSFPPLYFPISLLPPPSFSPNFIAKTNQNQIIPGNRLAEYVKPACGVHVSMMNWFSSPSLQ